MGIEQPQRRKVSSHEAWLFDFKIVFECGRSMAEASCLKEDRDIFATLVRSVK